MKQNIRLSGVSFGISLFCDAAERTCLVAGDGASRLAAELEYGLPNTEAVGWNDLPGDGDYRLAVLLFPENGGQDPYKRLKAVSGALAEDCDALVVLDRRATGPSPQPGAKAWDAALAAAGFHELQRYVLLPNLQTPSFMFPRNRRMVREACESGLVTLSTVLKKLPLGLAVRYLTGMLPGPFRRPDEIVHIGRRGSGAPDRVPDLLRQGSDPDRDYRVSILNPAGVGKMTLILSDSDTCEATHLRRVMSVKYPIYTDLRKDVDHLIQLGGWIGSENDFMSTVPAVGRPIRAGNLEIIPQKLLSGTPLLWRIRERGNRWTDGETVHAAEKVMNWCVGLFRKTPPPAPEDVARLAPSFLEPYSEIPGALQPHARAGMDRLWLQHGDLSCRNVFLQPEQDSIAVIDWDRMALGLPPFFDYFSFLASIGLVQGRYGDVMYGHGELQDRLAGIFREAAATLELDPAAGAMWFLRFLWVKCNISVHLARIHGAHDADFGDAPEWIQNHARIYREWLAMHLERHPHHFTVQGASGAVV